MAALSLLDEAEGKLRAEKELIATDRAVAALLDGQPASCEAILRETRRQLEYLAQKDLKEQAESVLTDDKAVAWKGREYERRMIDNLLIFSSLMADQQDAYAYSSQVMDNVYSDRLEVAGDGVQVKPVAYQETSSSEPSLGPVVPDRYSPNAFSAYLHAAVHSEKPMDSDVTLGAIRQVGFWNPANQVAQREDAGEHSDDLRIPFGTHTAKGHGVVHVVTFVGRVADWAAERAEPTSAALLIADRILSAAGKYSLPPTIAPVLIARPTACCSSAASPTVVRLTDGEPAVAVSSRTLVDLNKAAWDSYLAGRDDQIARAVCRRVVKKGTVYAAKDQLSVNSGGGIDLLLNVGGVLWEALEKPDTRHISLLPERIDVAQLELPVGTHTLEIVPVGAASVVQPPERISVRIEDGRNSFVLHSRVGSGSTRVHLSQNARP